MKFFFSILILISYQYFTNQIIIDARPAAVNKFSWAFPMHDKHEDISIQRLVKRKGAGWGKRSDRLIDDRPYPVHENAARIWFDDE